MLIWDESYLNTLLDDAESYIISALDCIFDRVSIAVTLGQSNYTLPTYVTRILTITWKGKRLTPLSFQEFCIANPASAVVSESAKTESPNSIPQFYVRHPSNYRDIRFWPTPNETIAAGTTNLFGSSINTCVIASVYRTESSDQPYLRLPSYLIRRVKKAYVLSRAFAKEGKGQDIQASQYYTKKLEILMGFLKEINSNVYLGKQRILNDADFAGAFATPARPILPADYPR